MKLAYLILLLRKYLINHLVLLRLRELSMIEEDVAIGERNRLDVIEMIVEKNKYLIMGKKIEEKIKIAEVEKRTESKNQEEKQKIED